MRYEGGIGWVKNSLRLMSDETERVTEGGWGGLRLLIMRVRGELGYGEREDCLS